MNAATVGSTCRSPFDGLRRLAAASAFLVGAGCALDVGESSAINSIFDEATRRPISYWVEDSQLRMAPLLERNFPAGTATSDFVDYVIGAGGECTQDVDSKPTDDAETYVCTHESYSYGIIGIYGVVMAYHEIANRWTIFIRSLDGIISSVEPSIKIKVTNLHESSYIEG